MGSSSYDSILHQPSTVAGHRCDLQKKIRIELGGLNMFSLVFRLRTQLLLGSGGAGHLDHCHQGFGPGLATASERVQLQHCTRGHCCADCIAWSAWGGVEAQFGA